MMKNFRVTTPKEQGELLGRGVVAQDWNHIFVSEDFSVEQLYMARLAGEVYLHSGARIYASSVSNYSVGERSVIDGVVRMECTARSAFGNGVEVAALNENGGRSVKIYDAMSAQVAYLATTHRHHLTFLEHLGAMVDDYAESRSATIGEVGADSEIVGAKIVRNVRVGERVRIEGASIISNATILSGAYVGCDVKAHDSIIVENARVDNGATIERCFVGENVIVSNGFTAVDSLLFASSHFENGEAASIFAGPYTVSHHKSSLLIAGMFSFFNAGSGSNQSNHLFKSGPVHQGVHLRGSKFGSSAYVMLPAINGAYTTVIGSHNSHHDTSDFPFSYLIEKDGRSTLLPAANLTSYGYVRDVEKWVKRDKRTVKRDIVSLEEHNPYITGFMLRGVNTINELFEKDSAADSYTHKNVNIRAATLRRGLTHYNKAIAAAIGKMLAKGDSTRKGDGRGRWLDIAGQYITAQSVEAITEAVASGESATLQSIDDAFRDFDSLYSAYAYDWALGLLSQLLGHEASAEEIQGAIAAAERSQGELLAMAMRDKSKDNSSAMMLSYGIDSDDEAVRHADFNAVRGL